MRQQNNQRLIKFKSLANHSMLGRDFKKLTPYELDFCRNFITDREEFTDDQFAHDVNRIGLNGELVDFKNKTLIWSLLSQSVEVKIKRRRE